MFTQELTQREKTIERIVVFVFGVLLPALSLFLVMNACPSLDDDTFALPLANARCAGDLIGQIGLCIIGLPFTITFALALAVEFIVLSPTNLDGLGGGLLLFSIPFLLASAFNGLFYWLMIRSFFAFIRK